MIYRITLHYLTPKGRESSYTDTVGTASMAEGIALVERLLHLTPQRRVGRIVHRTVEMV